MIALVCQKIKLRKSARRPHTFIVLQLQGLPRFAERRVRRAAHL